MTTGTDLNEFLLGDAAIAAVVGDRCFQNKVPEIVKETGMPAMPYIWYVRRSAVNERATDNSGPQDPDREFFDIECVAEGVGESIDLAGLVRTRLDTHVGTFGQSTVQGIFVDDHDDVYIPRNRFEDEGANVASLDVQIVN